MDDAAFDRIAAALGAAVSRRAGVLAAAATVAAAVAAGGAGDVDLTRAGGRRPRPAGPCGDRSRAANACTADKQCCTGICNRKAGRDNLDGMGRCRCLRRGEACKANRNCCGKLACVNRVCAASQPTPPPPPPPPPPPGPCDTPTVCASGCPRSTVQAGIDAATAGDTIYIGPGAWAENLTISTNLTLVGCGATVINTGTNRTITISGGASVELRDLSVDGTGTTTSNGGGIACTGALTLSGSTLVTRGAAPDGGCVDLTSASSLTMLDSAQISACFAPQAGGGIATGPGATITMSGTASITNCTASGGGGVSLSSSTLTMSGSSSISGNRGVSQGGGVYLNDSGPPFPPCTFTITAPATITNNTSASGGGVFSSGAANVATIATGTVTGNTPDNCAGAGLSC